MDFAASEAKKRGQSFPGTAVNLRRKRPGTNQPCPMRPTSAGRSDPGFVPGTPVDFAGTKNFFAPAGSNSHAKTVDMPHPVTRSRDRENAHLPGSSLRGSSSRPKAMNMPHPASAEGQRRKTKKAPGSDAFLLGAAIESKPEPFISSREMVLVPSLSLKVRIILSSYT